MMEINVAPGPIHGLHIFQQLVALPHIHLRHEAIDQFLKFFILMVQGSFVIYQLSLTAKEIIRCIGRQREVFIIHFKIGELQVYGQEASRGRNGLAHGDHRLACHRIYISRRNIYIPSGSHGALIIIRIRDTIVLQGFNPGIIGYHLRSAHGFAVNLNVFHPIQIRKAVHEGIQPFPQFFQGDIIIFPFFDIICTDGQNHLTGTHIALF